MKVLLHALNFEEVFNIDLLKKILDILRKIIGILHW